MDLQAALLVAGTLVIALVIAVSLVDLARRPRPRRVEPEAEAAGVLRMRVPRAAVQPITLTLDINPAPAVRPSTARSSRTPRSSPWNRRS